MGFNTEVSRIRSGLKSGKYRKKPNLAKAFMDPFIRGIERQEVERIQKEKEDRARAAAAAKAAAAEQKAKDKADAKVQDMVNFVLINNPEIKPTEAINKQLFLAAKAGNFASADKFQTYLDDNVKYEAGRTDFVPLNQVKGSLPPEMQLKQDKFERLEPSASKVASKEDALEKQQETTDIAVDELRSSTEYKEQKAAYKNARTEYETKQLSLMGFDSTKSAASILDEERKKDNAQSSANVSAIEDIISSGRDYAYEQIKGKFPKFELDNKALRELVDKESDARRDYASARNSDAVLKKTVFDAPDQASVQTEAMLGMDPVNEKVTEPSLIFGKKPEPVDIGSLTESTWLLELMTAEKDGNLEAIDAIEQAAKRQGWENIVGNYTRTELQGLSLEDLIEIQKTAGTQTSEEKTKILQSIIDVKQDTADAKKWWNSEEGMLEKDIQTLTSAVAIFGKETADGKELQNHLTKRIVIQTAYEKAKAGKEIDLTSILGNDPDFYEDWLLVNRNKAEYKTADGLNYIKQVIRLQASATERKLRSKTEALKFLKPKDLALQVWFKENGYFEPSLDKTIDQLIPSSGEMAKFENMWQEATKAAQDPEVWKDVDKIKGMDADTLQMVVNAGLLPADSEELEMVKLALGERITQDERKSASELGNFKGENFKSVTEMDTWLASRGGQSVFTSQEDTDAFIATRAILLTQEEKIANQELKNKSVNLYDQAAKIFLQGLDPSIQGTAKIDALAEWEKGWRASIKTVDKINPTTYTSANYAADLIKYGQLSTSTDAAEKAEGRLWMKSTKPLIEATLQAITQLDDEAKVKAIMDLGVSEDMARGLVSGTIVTGKDAFQNPVLIDKGQGSVTQMSVEENDNDVLRTDVPLTLSTDRGDILITPEDKQAALAELGGLGLNISNLNDFSAGFGIEGVVSKYINFFTEPLGATFNKDSQEAATTFKTLKTVTVLQLVTALPGIRDSMSLKNQLGTLLSNPQTFTGAKPKVLREMKAVQSFINSALATQQKNVRGKNINTTQRSKSNVSINALKGLSKIYDTAITKMGGGNAEAQQPIDKSVFVNPDSISSSQGDMTREQMIDEIRRLKSAKGGD